MKKYLLIILLTFLWSYVVYADDIMLVSMGDEIKQTTKIELHLPQLDNKEYFIDSIEIAIFEKNIKDEVYHIFGDTKLLENPKSLNISVDIGDTSRYSANSKYKIMYRYYVRAVSDISILEIAGFDKRKKDGWRAAGELTPTSATDSGLLFYQNSPPILNILDVSFARANIWGEEIVNCSIDELDKIYLPENVLRTGLQINYDIHDSNGDPVDVIYRLIDNTTNSIISENSLSTDGKVFPDTLANDITLVVFAIDAWGAKSEEYTAHLHIDNQYPFVASEFSDKGKAIKGTNLYSRFKIKDGEDEPMSRGMVYCNVMVGGEQIYANELFNNNDLYYVDVENLWDGEYTINLVMIDKAGNKSEHSLVLTLDNTPPKISFVLPSENSSALPVNKWTNTGSALMYEISDVASGISSVKTLRRNSIYSSVRFYIPKSQYSSKMSIPSSYVGKVPCTFIAYDNSGELDKVNNTISDNSIGNVLNLETEVWIDKKAPTVTISGETDKWTSSKDISIYYADEESAPRRGDASGLISKEYQVSENDTMPETWNTYDNGVHFDYGGVYYVFAKAIDNAGNVTVTKKKLKINLPCAITSMVKPTDSGYATIYNSFDDTYIIKPSAYSTKFYFNVSDEDCIDRIRANIRLVNANNGEVYSEAIAENTSSERDKKIIFNMSYLQNGRSLIDGVYNMYITINEIKNDNSELTTVENVFGCKILIKRNAPDMPVISSNYPEVTIDYPIDNGFSNYEELYKKYYHVIYNNSFSSYSDYSGSFTVMGDCVITATFKDLAGNISSSQRHISDNDSDDDISIRKDGNVAAVEESRPVTMYFIGTRREKESGINNDLLGFAR